MFLFGAFDNLDHNPSSSTSSGSFHGTCISIFQFPQLDDNGTYRAPLTFKNLPEAPNYSLPDRNVTICNNGITKAILPSVKMPEKNSNQQEEFKNGEFIHWSAYLASLAPPVVNPPAILSVLPLFYEKASSISMVKHGMDNVKKITEYLNSGQIPIMTFDLCLSLNRKPFYIGKLNKRR